MSALLRVDGGVAATYALVGDDDGLPKSGAVLLELARWERDRAQLDGRDAPLAIRLPNTADIATLDSAVLNTDLIVLQFPSFGDGRGYSQARLLRDARGYKGELRATGAAVVRDQLLGMVRCGIDSFELRADQSSESCMQALKEFSIVYQPPSDDIPQIRRLRRKSMST